MRRSEKLTAALLLLLATSASATTSKYILGGVGLSCTEACFSQHMNCNPAVQTNGTVELFTQLGVECTANPKPWWAENQPGWVPSNQTDPNSGECVGYMDTPSAVLCSGAFPTVARVCRCDAPSTVLNTFGTVESAATLPATEKHVWSHVLAPGQVAAMTHLWITYNTKTDPSTIIRYYVDGESEASVQIEPSLASGTGFYDATAPWGTEWFGKGAADGSWFWNIKVPFNSSIRVTVQHAAGDAGYYIILRGGTNIDLSFGGAQVPPQARLMQTVVQGTFKPLQWVDLESFPRGSSGVHFMSTLAIESGNLNVLEGCFHMYTADLAFPGIVLSSGGEDYFDSGWYFDAGEFRLPTAGLTHFDMNNVTKTYQLSMYKLHTKDPLQWSDGFRFVWRIGDTVNAASQKCFTESGGTPVGSPQPTNVTSYSFSYVW